MAPESTSALPLLVGPTPQVGITQPDIFPSYLSLVKPRMQESGLDSPIIQYPLLTSRSPAVPPRVAASCLVMPLRPRLRTGAGHCISVSFNRYMPHSMENMIASPVRDPRTPRPAASDPQMPRPETPAVKHPVKPYVPRSMHPMQPTRPLRHHELTARTGPGEAPSERGSHASPRDRHSHLTPLSHSGKHSLPGNTLSPHSGRHVEPLMRREREAARRRRSCV
ncbi:hypothetical protein VUR80DRAFT_5160 [Thermomyces stellatus]